MKSERLLCVISHPLPAYQDRARAQHLLTNVAFLIGPEVIVETRPAPRPLAESAISGIVFGSVRGLHSTRRAKPHLYRTNIGNAKLVGLQTDLGMTNAQYNASLTIFFVSYSVFEPATNVLLKRLRPSIFIPSIMMAWVCEAFFSLDFCLFCHALNSR